MKHLIGAIAVSAALALSSAAVAGPKGTPNSYGYVPHQKTGGNHPGGHSSIYGHKGQQGQQGAFPGGANSTGGSYGGGHVHNGCHGHPPKQTGKGVCFPPGHCKSINQGYYGPPGQQGR